MSSRLSAKTGPSRSRSWIRGVVGGLGALLVGLGCQEEPSVLFRWKVGKDDPPPLSSSYACSRAGISDVVFGISEGEATSLPEAEVTSWFRRKSPCFPATFRDPEARLEGPSLEPGTYTAWAVGLKRNGDRWYPSAGLDPAAVHHAFTLKGDEVVDLADDLVLEPPPQCEDEIDNDGDGLVDAFDPACAAGGTRGSAEDGTVTNTQFTVDLSFLHHNPFVGAADPKCSKVGISEFDAKIFSMDGSELASFRLPCSEILSFSHPLPAGCHRLELTGIGPSAPGSTREAVRTRPDWFSVEFGTSVTEGGKIRCPLGASSAYRFERDVGPDDFVEPLKSALRFRIDLDDGKSQPDCRWRSIFVRVVDERGRALVGESAERLGRELVEGAYRDWNECIPLDDSMNPTRSWPVPTTEVEWGGYRAVVEVFSRELAPAGRPEDGDAPCYSTEGARQGGGLPGIPLFPNLGPYTLYVPRVADAAEGPCAP